MNVSETISSRSQRRGRLHCLQWCVREGSSAALAGLFLSLAAGTAHAHLVSTRFGDFFGGALHPLTALEHVLPWFALGVLAGMQGPRCGRWLLLAFPLGLAAGSWLALLIHQEPFVTTLNMASFVVVGALVAAACPLATPLLIGLGVVFGFIHGYENGTAMNAETNKLLFTSGVAAVGYVVVALVTAMTVTFLGRRDEWRRIGLRALGSWIAAVGIMLLGFRLMVR